MSKGLATVIIIIDTLRNNVGLRPHYDVAMLRPQRRAIEREAYSGNSNINIINSDGSVNVPP